MMRRNTFMLILVLVLSTVLILGCSETTSPEVPINEVITSGSLSFEDTGQEICKRDGKPIVMMFSTSTCPHCIWISDTFDKVAVEYKKEGTIYARHWVLDKKEDTLTFEADEEIPVEDFELMKRFSTGSVPTFVFGCKYVRIGNAFEGDDGLSLEEAEFRKVIDLLLK